MIFPHGAEGCWDAFNSQYNDLFAAFLFSDGLSFLQVGHSLYCLDGHLLSQHVNVCSFCVRPSAILELWACLLTSRD